jgi:hypothetical protein
MAVGIFSLYPAVVLQGVLLHISLYAFSPYAKSVRPKKAALVIISTAFAMAPLRSFV